MHPELLDILRCPYCGGGLELVESSFHQLRGELVVDGILACECCVFPVVDGIPVLHLQPAATAAREQVEAGRPLGARHILLGLDTDRDRERFDAVALSPDATFRAVLDALGDQLEAGYLYHRFSDPTFLVADAIVRAVGAAALRGGGRAIDICGGAGHLTRALPALSSERPVLADLYYPKTWLARRFTAPTATPVCCDANAPLPFARGAFTFAVCSDALMYVWVKRLLVSEMLRIVNAPAAGTVLVNHAHNQQVWSPSHGQTLTPEGYRRLFDTAEVHTFGESGLFEHVVAGEAFDLSRDTPEGVLAGEAALTFVSSRTPGVFGRHRPQPPGPGVNAGDEWRINPLYDTSESGGVVRGRLHFPSADYETEYAASRSYLPAEILVARDALEALRSGSTAHGLEDLIRRRAILALPAHYG
ncbi:MAG: hypothetical protein AB7Q29_03140 [Vicinamibacterales bacterium]